jgi:DNA-binding transcriptional MerR regulator
LFTEYFFFCERKVRRALICAFLVQAIKKVAIKLFSFPHQQIFTFSHQQMPIEKKYFSIGEVAKELYVATSLIRFWESQFSTVNPKKNKSGARRYTKEDIEQIRTIYFLVKERGYTLQGAKELLENSSAKDKLQAIQSLEKVKAFLVDLKEKVVL